MKKLVIIDGKSVFYRGYYAMGNLALPDGTPTGGVYGFAAIAIEIVRRLQPDTVVVAWDSKTSVSKRRAIYPEYKAGRQKPGDDFYTQIPILQKLVKTLSWSFVECDNYEADDIIGTLNKQADDKGDYMIYIVSSDLDMLQIVDENTRMYRILQGFSKLEELDVPAVEKKYGIKKSQFLDLKALKGDASDNIPGVPGIGQKTAAKLLEKYQTLDEIYQHIDEITGSTHDKLMAGKDSAFMSRELGRIMLDAPVKLDDMPPFHLDKMAVVRLFTDLEFHSLIRRFGLQKSGWGGRDGATEGGPESRRGLARDTRDDGLSRRDPSVASSSSASSPFIIDWDIKTLMHNDSASAEAILQGEKFWDLVQAAFLLNPLARQQISLLQSDREAEYKKQQEQYKEFPKLKKVLTDFDLPLIPVLYKMEKHGMLLDQKYFAKLKKEFDKRLQNIEQKIYTLVGKTFNINSPLQLAEVLFGDLGLPTQGITKRTRGYSTGAKTLEKLQGQHPIIELLQDYRAISKLVTTYVTPLPELADEEGYVHTTFNQNVTATGRLSSTNPNLQNIPVRTEEGRRIRTGFIASPGKVFVSADYSQFELRLAAVLAGDQKLIDDFDSGTDIHTKTAAEVFNIPITKVTKNQRRMAKVVNFGVLYGMSARGLSQATKMSIAEAQEFINGYFELRAPIRKYLDNILKQAHEKGYVETYFGRRRPTPDVKSSNFMVRTAAERAAQNMPIQGTEADLMKRAMITLDAELPKGANLVMQVHDSLIIECDQKQANQVAKLLKNKMEQVAPELKIKLAVDVTTGINWGEL